MADLIDSARGDADDGSGDGPRDRAQLVLVTALALATALIALVLLVNTAIYAENLATRDPDVGDEDALSYEAAVVDGVGGVMDHENDEEYDDYAAVRRNVTAGIVALDAQLSRTNVERGIGASINRSTVDYREGQLIRQTNASRAFTSGINVTTDWTVASDVEHARKYAATVDDSNLVTTDAENASSDGAFHVYLDGANDWKAYLYLNGAGEIAVAVEPGGTTTATEVCSVAAPEATVDFTAGTLAGEPCEGLTWAEGIGSDRYDVNYRNGDRASGTYNLTVPVSAGGAVGAELNDPVGDSPYHVPAVYSTTAEIVYRSPELEYRATVRVAPEEPDD